MQIRTALSIGTGVAIGVIFGMGVSEDSKIKMVTQIKKKIVEALTGEKWEPKKKNRKPVNYTTYTRHDTTLPDRKIFLFDNEKDAYEVLSWIHSYLDNYGQLTVFDLASKREIASDYIWDNYGWKNGDDDSACVRENPEASKYEIFLPRPRYLNIENIRR